MDEQPEPTTQEEHDEWKAHSDATAFSLEVNHGIPLHVFDQWLRDTVTANDAKNEFTDKSKQAARDVLDGTDHRTFDADNEMSQETWSVHLPLASQTQFVEHRVKEANAVSAADRQEEQCSACAIVGSFSVLQAGIENDSSTPSHVKLPLKSANKMSYRRRLC